MRSSEAKRKAEQLFLRLSRNTMPQNARPIVVNYAKRFPPGECVIAVVVPVDGVLQLLISLVCMAQQRYHYQPTLINGRHGVYLRLMYRFRKIKAGEHKRILEYAKMLAEWAERVFEKKAIVSPLGGLVGARRVLRYR